MYWNYSIWKYYFGTSSCVLCREAVLISECPLSGISLYFNDMVAVPHMIGLESMLDC